MSQPLPESRLTYQPDIFQRYTFLAGVVQALVDAGAAATSILDVGCGPVRGNEERSRPRIAPPTSGSNRVSQRRVLGQWTQIGKLVRVARGACLALPPAQRALHRYDGRRVVEP